MGGALAAPELIEDTNQKQAEIAYLHMKAKEYMSTLQLLRFDILDLCCATYLI